MPKIYIILTPIGNLKDITFRAIETLNKVKLVYAEDTRKTKIILKKYNIEKKILSFHIYNENKNAPKIIENLKEDDEIALVSDAGTPLISDPGFSLINTALKKKKLRWSAYLDQLHLFLQLSLVGYLYIDLYLRASSRIKKEEKKELWN